MVEVIDLRRAEDPRDVVHRVCQAFASGELVILPTETQYTLVGSAIMPEVGVALQQCAESSPSTWWSAVPTNRATTGSIRRHWPKN